MKNLKVIFMAILAGITLVACTPKKEALLRDYEEACQNGDATAALRVISKMEKEFGEANLDSIYTETEQLRFETATATLQQKVAEKAMEQLGGTMNQLSNMGVNPFENDDDDDDDDE